MVVFDVDASLLVPEVDGITSLAKIRTIQQRCRARIPLPSTKLCGGIGCFPRRRIASVARRIAVAATENAKPRSAPTIGSL